MTLMFFLQENFVTLPIDNAANNIIINITMP